MNFCPSYHRFLSPLSLTLTHFPFLLVKIILAIADIIKDEIQDVCNEDKEILTFKTKEVKVSYSQ